MLLLLLLRLLLLGSFLRGYSCGSSPRPQPQVYGGSTVPPVPGYVPYQGRLVVGGYNSLTTAATRQCSAVLVLPTWALTAAQCVVGASYITIYLGSYDVQDTSLGVAVSEAYVHCNFTAGRPELGADLALLRWATPVSTTLTVAPIDLFLPAFDASAFAQAMVSGWGLAQAQAANSSSTYSPAARLQVATVTLAPSDSVRQWLLSHLSLWGGDASLLSAMPWDSFVLTQSAVAMPCEGDTGGPLVVTLAGARKLLGVVSLTYGCGVPSMPAVYTSVAYYASWVAQVVWGVSQDAQAVGELTQHGGINVTLSPNPSVCYYSKITLGSVPTTTIITTTATVTYPAGGSPSRGEVTKVRLVVLAIVALLMVGLL